MPPVGVLVSTSIGASFWLTATASTIPLPVIWVLVFGVLISPTNPIAVLPTLKKGQSAFVLGSHHDRGGVV